MKNSSILQKTNWMMTAVTSLALTAGCAKVEFSPVPVENNQSSQSPDSMTPPPSYNPKVVKTTEVVAYGNKQVDFLLVLDDSSSMLPELRKLAARLEAFVTSLDDSQIQWQMCLTTTRGQTNGADYGRLLSWSRYSPTGGRSTNVLARGTTNLTQIFQSTIENLQIGGGNSGDERGIKAALDNFTRPASAECYRPGAAVSVILISDEDERSVGGDRSKVKSNDGTGSYIPLEASDLPVNLIKQAHTTFGADVRFTFSSIIVKPGDHVCEAIQDQAVSPSHEGFHYEEASRLTDGGVGSICDDDYSATLNTFKNKIVNSMSSMNLECKPVLSSVKVQVSGMAIYSYKVDGKVLKFDYPLVEGTHVDLEYTCVETEK